MFLRWPRGPVPFFNGLLTMKNKNRSAFTLIELLVVIALIMILAGLAAAFLPTLGNNARAATGATMLQQWLLTAQQKALRDRVPCGVRLLNPYVDLQTLIDPNSGKPVPINYPFQVRQCQYIEQPDDFPSSVPLGPTSGTAGTLFMSNINFMNQVTLQMNVANRQIAAGDYLEVFGGGPMRTITSVTGGVTTTLVLNSPMTTFIPKTSPTSQYRIVRLPRVTGDDVLQLPDSVIIDLKTNTDYKNSLNSLNPSGTSNVDILFSPSGSILAPSFPYERINLWVRLYEPSQSTGINPDLAVAALSEQTIVSINVRSGQTAAFPAAVGANPYQFIR